MSYKPLNETSRPYTKYRLKAAFAAMRKAGLFARQSYKCCSSCACAAIQQDAGGGHRGAVFYHQQDAMCLRERYVKTMSIRFGSLATPDDAEAVAAVGREAVAILNKHGVLTSWDGSAGLTIQVLLNETEASRYDC